MDKGPDQNTRDDPDGLVEAIAENDSDDLYAPPEQVPEKTVRKPHDEAPDNSPEDLDLDSLDGAIEALRGELADRYDDVTDVIRPPLIDAVPEDDLKPGSEYDFKPMVCAWIYRLIAPSDGYSVVSWEQLADRLDENDDLATSLGFGGETPSERTLREQWMTRVRPGFRDHVRYMAAECAVKAEDYELETAADIRENLIADHTAGEEPDVDPIGEMEQETKEDAYSIQADIIRDVCSYDRDDSSEWESHLFTDAAAHMCRRNEYAEQGIVPAASAATRELTAKTVTRPWLHLQQRQARRRYPAQRERLRRIQNREEYLLLVFDAGRADVLGPLLADAFETTPETTFSAARDTFEWISTQWVGDGFDDLTYVTGMVPIAPDYPEFEAEGFNSLYATDAFVDDINEIVPVWDTHWDASIGVDPPEAVTERALNYMDRDQVVVHYAQPHTPYIGTPQILGHTNNRSAKPHQGEPNDRPIWERVQTGALDDLTLWLAYVGNAVRAVQSAVDVVEAWDGPVVATADHGEALGEWGLYAHHRTPHPYRRLVPWAEITGVRDGDGHDGPAGDVEDKLQALGYR